MTIEEIKRDFKLYFETFQFSFGVGPKQLAEMHYKQGRITKEEYENFLVWVDAYWKQENQRFFDELEAEDRMKDKKPYPKELENGNIICPVCGNKVWRSPEVMLPRFPIYTYYCSKCSYCIQTRVLYEKSEVDPCVEEKMWELRQQSKSKEGMA